MFLQRHAVEKWIKNDALDVSVKWLQEDVSAHCHEFYELELILEGQGTYIVDGISYAIERGALFFMSPVSFHQIAFHGATRLVNVMFPVDGVREDLLERICSASAHFYTLLSEQDTQFVLMLIENLQALLSSTAGKEKLLFDPYLHCLLAKIASLAKENTAPRLLEPIDRVLIWLQNNFTNRITIADAAHIANYSPHYFCETFKKRTGATFLDYLRELRFSHARNLLRYSSMTVTQVCYECGFSDYAHFTTEFKKRYGISPLQYKKNMIV